jgi:hypothetical protein
MGHDVKIGNLFVRSPNGIAFVVDDREAYTMDPGGDYFAGTAAPDNSFHRTRIKSVTFEWGRVGTGIVGRIRSDTDADVTFKLIQTWPGFATNYTPTKDGATGTAADCPDWSVRFDPVPTKTSAEEVAVHVPGGQEVRLVAGLGDLPPFADVDRTLDKAAAAYDHRRPAASGDWGNFVGAIADNLNNSRIYSSDDKRVAISVSRGWAPDPNDAPYFCWDSFFNGALSCLDDPATARETVRAILSWQTAEGLVPNFGHWKFAGGRSSDDRSQPPVGSMCVWKMQQRWPDRAFLAEVYPKLLKWHRWWPTARDGQHDGLLEWGSATAGEQGARWETGWDDTVHYDGSHMVGQTLNAYAVDLSSMWAMDAEFLARIADALGKSQDAADLRTERERTIRLINEKLWNPDLGIYCSRLWDGTFLTRITPMNFYPLLAGAADEGRAAQVLKVMTDPKRFWGDWVLPTVPYNDPVWKQQDYWRGKVWAPVNFLVFQGLQRYADPKLLDEYADKSVRLFMRNWTAKGVCGENYLSTTGEQSSDPHYTWGALLCLIGVESICRIDPDGSVVLNGTADRTVEIKNLPIHGKLYEVSTTPGHAVLKRNGRVVLEAKGEEVRKRID